MTRPLTPLSGAMRQIAIVLLTATMLFTNLVVGTGSFSEGGAEGEIQTVYYLYQSAFTPAPFTFAVWAPIFLGCVLLAILQARPSERGNTALDRFALPYAAALIANALTPFAPIGWGLVVVAALLASLTAAYLTLTAGPERARWFYRVPVALFATWALVATALNATQVIVAWGGEVGPLAAAALIAGVMSLGAWAIRATREAAILAVMAWAGIGIAAEQWDAAILVTAIALTTAASAAVAWRAGALGGWQHEHPRP